MDDDSRDDSSFSEFGDLSLTHAYQLFFCPETNKWICQVGAIVEGDHGRVHIDQLSSLFQESLVLLSQKTNEDGFIMNDEEWEEHLKEYEKQKEELEIKRKSFKVIDGGKNDQGL